MTGISVIIPAFNREKYISKAINSVLIQDYEGNLEIIVSDDGSTDKTIEIVESYGNKVKLIRKPVDCISQGASGARNRALKLANYGFISFLDSDDFFLPGHLNNMYKAISSKINYGFAFCRLLEMDDSNPELFRLWTKRDITSRDIKNLVVSRYNVIQTNGFLFKREVFKKIGLFDENLRNGEDIDMWMRISERYEGAFSDTYGAVIRKHASGQLTDTDENRLIKTHIKVFTDAIARCKTLNLNNFTFRYLKLNYIVYKYRFLQLPTIYKYHNWLRNLRVMEPLDEWYSLDYFFKEEQVNVESSY